MSTHGTRGVSADSSHLPDAVPFCLPALSRLSWELGSRVVADAELLDEWEHAASGRTLGVYDVTDHTVVLGVRTPVGRERFFGATKEDFAEKRPLLSDADDWLQRE
ncbi:hypothetical protein [Halorussus lipolyticus]|uniref:hypothetical protein n=1 Tax=Halorussus lipolyticus TaxID=3034024 RepID=UPI0023E79CFC|nr:hypothetical protein [Halorussus sp. DT80]